MWQSLRSPKVTRNPKGEYLVGYWFFKYKLGYFVAEVDVRKYLGMKLA
jgi:hypothetical protein